MKNYYEILRVGKEAGEDEIRRSYRKLAMEFHPDRNPDNPEAEEKFKEIAEAYGVLTDPVKRRQYDAHMAAGGSQQQYQSGFSYSQEDILKDLFRDPRFQQMFQGILREFQRSGLRSSPYFLRKSFFGGKGGVLLGGLFLVGSVAGPALLKSGKKALPQGRNVFKALGHSIGNLLNKQKRKSEDVVENLDVTYEIPLTREELDHGRVTEVVSSDQAGRHVFKVKIPAGSKSGQKLRLQGKGRQSGEKRGDLYLLLCDKKG
ncbi:MAG: DnaJ domain-containing protein [Desulfopila sp.]|jgi:curved DNA-binding protein CbpA|nr:DnaJ domain-containing protein [Desulfopila sp.]